MTASARLAARALLLLLAAAPASALASCCVLEDPLVAVSDAAARGGGLRLALDAESSSSAAAMGGMEGLERIRQRTVRLSAAQVVLDRVTVVAAVPLARREWSGHGAPSLATGLGDVDAGVRIAAWRRVDWLPHPTRWAVVRAQALALSLGTSLPTGENDLAHGGVRLDEHAQLGTGAWGPYAGALYRLHQDPWELVASATGRLRTTNGHGYRGARALLAGAELQRTVLERFWLGAGADVRWASHDLQDGVAVPHSGGTLLSLVASAGARVVDRVALRARVQVPTISWLSGDQRPGVGVGLGLQLDLR